MSDLSDLPQSEAIVIARAVETRGEFFDEIEVSAEDFLTNEAAWAYETIQRMRQTQKPIDSMTVGITDGRVEQYVWKVAALPTYAAAFHADAVHEAGIRRRVTRVATMMQASAPTMEIGELLDTSRRQIEEAAGLRRTSLQYVGDLVDEVIADIERPRMIYPTPWRNLTDQLGGGFRPGALYVLAARPSVGKTAIALQMATSMAKRGPVAMTSLEMPREEIIRRLIAQGTKVPHAFLERGTPLTPLWQAKVDGWVQSNPPALRIAIDDRSTVTASDVRAHARSVQRTSGDLAGVVVDYLQLMSGGGSGASRQEFIAETTRSMKIMARDLECPVLLLSQLNRNSEARLDKKPMLADLRESGAIEQDADVVMLMYRDPNFVQDPGPVPLPVPLDVDVAKNRHGPAGEVHFTWEGSHMRAYAGEEWE